MIMGWPLAAEVRTISCTPSSGLPYHRTPAVGHDYPAEGLARGRIMTPAAGASARFAERRAGDPPRSEAAIAHLRS